MKILFSILMLPVYLLAPVIAGMTFFARCHISGICSAPSSETLSHIYMGVLHLCMALGILGGAITALYCAALCVTGFIIKSWYRAGLAGGISFGMGYCVWYLNSIAL